MKFRWKSKYAKISAYAVGVIVIAAIAVRLLDSLPELSSALDFVGSVLTPVFWGIVVAYLLNPIVQFFEQKVFKKWAAKSKRSAERAHFVSMLITVLLTIAVIAGFIWLIAPQIIASIMGIGEKFSMYIDRFLAWASVTFKDNPDIISIIQDPLKELERYVNDLWSLVKPELSTLVSGAGNGVITVLLAIKDFVIGFILGIYLLTAKNMILMQLKKLLFALFNNDFCQHFFDFSGRTNKIFRHYIVGLILDAAIVGTITFIGTTIIGTPYPILMAVIIAITNFIPFFGPFIGGIPTAFIVLIDDPIKCLWYVLFLLVLQQIDGNILVPFIQGDRTGVPSVWVLVAIIVGGGLFGFAGMLLSVPVFAVIYMLSREWLNSKLRKKNMPEETVLYDVDITRFTNDYQYTEDERKKDLNYIKELAKSYKKKSVEKVKERFENKYGSGDDSNDDSTDNSDDSADNNG